MDENGTGGRKKRGKWMRMVWEEGKKGWKEENGMGRRKKGLDGETVL